MESEPLVNTNSRMMKNYNSEDFDGSSILQTNGMDNEDSTHNTSDRGVDPEQEKVDYTLLERFHEDALQQVGHGKIQWLLFFVCGLVLAADLSELLAIIMSSKSAQFEFCVDEQQKSWLVSATLIGMAMGSVFWGFVGDRVGRRRAMMYCLGVGSIFSGASVIMPTEGTFITSRIFSSTGLGGCLPLALTYFAEFIQEKRRRLAVSLLFLFWPIGAGLTIMSSWFILPENGFHLSEELKEHFSAWRKLLLASSAPALVSLVMLIFMPEAPLTLMKNGRDAESLNVYKRIHKFNRGSRATFCFSEIEIPAVHLGITEEIAGPWNVAGDLSRALETFWVSFLTLWTENRRKLTIKLVVIWFLAAMGSGALTSWILSSTATLRNWTFDRDAKMVENKLFNQSNISDLVNVHFRESQFEDVSIENIMMNHVKFENCSFKHVNFTNVKASYVLFLHSDLNDCFFVGFNSPTFVGCLMENITYAGLNPACHLIPDFNMQLSSDMIESGFPVLGVLMGSLLAAVLMTVFSRSKLTTMFLLLASLTCIGLTVLPLDATWALVGHTLINVLIAGMWSVLVTTFDKYPFWVRGGALGFCCSFGRLGSFFGVVYYLFGSTLHGILVPIFSSVCLVLATCVASRSHF